MAAQFLGVQTIRLVGQHYICTTLTSTDPNHWKLKGVIRSQNSRLRVYVLDFKT